MVLCTRGDGVNAVPCVTLSNWSAATLHRVQKTAIREMRMRKLFCWSLLVPYMPLADSRHLLYARGERRGAKLERLCY